MTVEQAIENARTLNKNDPLTDVLITGFDNDGNLFISSNAMNKKDALWLAMLSVDHARGFI